MAFGPFARIVAQVVMVAGGAIGRAVKDAYKEAAKSGAGKAMGRKRMNLPEARQIIDVSKGATAEEIGARAEKMVALNVIDAKGVGSPYLQSKIKTAAKVLLQDLSKKGTGQTSGGASPGDTKDGPSDGHTSQAHAAR